MLTVVVSFQSNTATAARRALVNSSFLIKATFLVNATFTSVNAVLLFQHRGMLMMVSRCQFMKNSSMTFSQKIHTNLYLLGYVS